MTVGALDEGDAAVDAPSALILIALLDVLVPADGATAAVDLRRLQTRTEPNRAASAGIAPARRDFRQSLTSATGHLLVRRMEVSSTVKLHLRRVDGQWRVLFDPAVCAVVGRA